MHFKAEVSPVSGFIETVNSCDASIILFEQLTSSK